MRSLKRSFMVRTFFQSLSKQIYMKLILYSLNKDLQATRPLLELLNITVKV